MKSISELTGQAAVTSKVEDIDLLLMPCSELVRLGLRSYIIWEKDVHQFFRRLHALHTLQESLLISLMEQWEHASEQCERYPSPWKEQLEHDYDLLLPEQASSYLLNPYRASLLLACMKIFLERCTEEILRVIALMRPSWIYQPDTLLQTFCTDDSLLAEFLLMLEELYDIRIAVGDVLFTDSVAQVAKKVTMQVFAQSPELQQEDCVHP